MDLQKAWDRGPLLAALKEQGIDLLEPAAEKLLETITSWAEASLVIEGGVKAAVGLPLIQLARPLIKAQIDKIDPADGDGK